MRLGLVCLLLAGCAAVFDLTEAPNVDRDNDGKEDTLDNCPNAANPDQSDFDKDGVGDACDTCDVGSPDDVDHDGIPDGCDGCIGNGEDLNNNSIDDNCECTGVDVDHDGVDDCMDPCIADLATGDVDLDGVGDNCDTCLSGPNHDEDGDGIFDPCDNCPTVANHDQADFSTSDQPADNVGDKCDQSLGFDVQLYDAFDAAHPVDGWYQQGSGWIQEADAMHLDSNAGSVRMLGTADTLFTAWVDIDDLVVTLNGRVGVFASDQQLQPAARSVSCEYVRGQVVSDRLLALVDGSIVSSVFAVASPPLRIVMRVDVLAKTVKCGLDQMVGSVETAGALSASPPSPWFVGLDGSRASARFTSYTLINAR